MSALLHDLASRLLVPAAWVLTVATAAAATWLAIASIRHAIRKARRRAQAKATQQAEADALFAHIDELELLEELWALPEANRRNSGPRPRKETQ